MFEPGQKVILMEDYSTKYPAGTVGIYMHSRMDGGTFIDVIIIGDENLKVIIDQNDVTDLGDFLTNNDDLLFLERYLTTFRPERSMLGTPNDLQSEVDSLNRRIAYLNELMWKCLKSKTPGETQ